MNFFTTKIFLKYGNFFVARVSPDGKESYASQSIPAVLMMIFQYSEDMGESLTKYLLLIRLNLYV